MALEDLTGATKYLSALNKDWPLNTDQKLQGDDHIRGIKNVLLNQFGPLAAPVDFAQIPRKNIAEVIQASWVFGFPVFIGKAGSGTGSAELHVNDAGATQWLTGIGSGVGAKDYVVYNFAKSLAIAGASNSLDQWQVLGRAGFLVRAAYEQSQVVAGTRTLAEADINNVIRNDGASVLTLANVGYNGALVGGWNGPGGVQTINQGSTVLSWIKGGSVVTGNRTVAANSMFVLYKQTSGEWSITGNGIT